MSPIPGVVASSRRTAGGGGGGGSALPTKVAGAYWPYWEDTYPDQISSNVNTLFIAFAVNSGSNGAIQWPGLNTLNQSTFQTRLQTTRAAGRCCILSIGGEFVTLTIDNSTEVTNFVNSVKSLYTTWGGFDGIDWDVEGGLVTSGNRQYFVAASQELKDFYGANFAISMSYQGPDSQYKTMAQELEGTGDLDWASIQYYDYPGPATSDVSSRLSEMVNTWGVSPAHLGVGVKYEPGNGNAWQTTSGLVSMWNTVEGTYPTLRGCTNWETQLDRNEGGGYATTVCPAITS